MGWVQVKGSTGGCATQKSMIKSQRALLLPDQKIKSLLLLLPQLLLQLLQPLHFGVPRVHVLRLRPCDERRQPSVQR